MLRARTGRLAMVYAIAILFASVAHATEIDLQNDIEAVLADENLVGIAWTLVDESGQVRVGATGLRDNLRGSAFTPDTRFHVGSLTKTLLATGVLRLATEGRVDLDAPVVRYLPDLFAEKPSAEFSAITVRHLLDHTAGLNDAHLWQMFSERADADTPLIAAFPNPESQLQVRAQPGSRFSYSNMGYTLLGMVIESIVGSRYESYLDAHVLAPLAMHDSTFAFTTQEGDNADPTLAWGHVDDGSRYAASPIFLRPAGQFTSTATDLARFSQFLLSNGVVGDQVFVDKALMSSRAKPFATEAANAGLLAGYSLGLGRRDRHGVVGFCHGGNIVGFVAMLCIFPEENKAFAYSVNTDSETANYGGLDRSMIRALKITEAPQPRTTSLAPDVLAWEGRYALSPNRFQTFSYLDTVFGSISVSAGDQTVTIASLQQDDRELRPVAEHQFSASNRATTSHAFFQGQHGEFFISDGFRTYEKISMTFMSMHWISILAGLAGLTWIFIAGSISLVRHRTNIIRRPEAPAFVASALLIVPIPFFFTQSFMALGDVTLASVLLAIVTLTLPIGMILTMVRARRKWTISRLALMHGIAAFCVLQWCAVLLAYGMLPFRLWA